jgi:hypothetical protein
MTSVAKNALRLGPGQFTHIDDRFEELEYQRHLFLEAVRQEQPQVLESLETGVLPSYRVVWERLNHEADARGQSGAWLLFSGALEWPGIAHVSAAREPDVAKLRGNLENWAKAWFLYQSADYWILDRALAALRNWCESPGLFERDGATWMPFARSLTLELTQDEQAIKLPEYSWNPQLEPLKEVKERIRADLFRQLDAELDRISALAVSRGLRRTTSPNTGLAHYLWLADYQVCGADWPAIASRYSRDEKRVQRDALALAKRIGLAPRRRAGRPSAQSPE